ncbi:aspartate kinase [Roseixanthobacter glucoisosaccharinicivorans]|uniref:aspartate kinase n=1 Tax=Roseixanthobacter glucoisosaccharinicivorans TaxID=3119923 RepID=UPI00372A73F1
MAFHVVKLGGSLERGGDIRSLAGRLAGWPGVMVVPGGGRFADAVRAAQGPLALSERACHAMAILAMEQMAHALADCAPALVPCRTLDDMKGATDKAALWFPADLLLGAADISASWDVTSDSLACWLATRLHAPRLTLVKAPGALVHTPARGDGPAEWSARGVVDRAFPAFAARFRGIIRLVAADDAPALDQLFPSSRTASAA